MASRAEAVTCAKRREDYHLAFSLFYGTTWATSKRYPPPEDAVSQSCEEKAAAPKLLHHATGRGPISK